jgi:nitroreductase
MPAARSEAVDPAARAAHKRQVLERFEHAEHQWGAAMRAHRLAPPDLGFAGRLRALAEAAAAEAAVCREAASLGLAWRPIPGAETAEPPYELRPGTGRRGPDELWERFDTAVAHFNHANAGTDASSVAGAYADVSVAALALGEAVDREDRSAARKERRSA